MRKQYELLVDLKEWEQNCHLDAHYNLFRLKGELYYALDLGIFTGGIAGMECAIILLKCPTFQQCVDSCPALSLLIWRWLPEHWQWQGVQCFKSWSGWQCWELCCSSNVCLVVHCCLWHTFEWAVPTARMYCWMQRAKVHYLGICPRLAVLLPRGTNEDQAFEFRVSLKINLA